MENLIFDQNYYNAIIKDFGYNPLEFEPISFSLGKLSREDLQRLWLCHMNGNTFANSFQNGEKTVVTTGFGMSGVPHAGTLGQILRALRLQRSGVVVQIVLGDLDAYNGKNKDMDYVQNLAEEIVKRYHGAASSKEESVWFDQTFSLRKTPSDIPSVVIEKSELFAIDILDKFFGGSKSKSEIRRLFNQGAVSLNDCKITDPNYLVVLSNDDVFQVGKRVWFKIVL